MAACASCEGRLILDVHDDDDNEAPTGEVPDDLELPCGCHFHWQCLLDEADQVALSLKCPSCQTYLPANQPGPSVTNPIRRSPAAVSILTRYHSEGGVQAGHDILPDLTEEAYLSANPSARPARALLTMCAEGDVVGIVGILQSLDDDDDDDDDGLSAGQLLRYQDPLSGMRSGLHVAVENDREEVFYLLLYLASKLDEQDFPPEVVQSAREAGLRRPEDRASYSDIRTLTDDKGEAPETYARRAGGRWAQWADGGVFTQAL